MTAAPRQVRVFGMRRSGNHAIIDWLRRNLPGETVFLNDCRPGDPFRTFQMMETPRGDVHGPGFRDTRWFAQFDEGRETRGHIVSYEDQLPRAVPAPEGWRGRFETIVIRRSFLNWLASFQKLVAGRQRGTEWGVRGPAEILPFIRAYSDMLAAPGLHVCYDRWCADPGYRRGRLDALGLTPRDNGTGREAVYGGGSSFDGGDRARRWKAMAEERSYVALAREAGRDDAFMARLAPLYPDDERRLLRLVSGGRLSDEEVTTWSS